MKSFSSRISKVLPMVGETKPVRKPTKELEKTGEAKPDTKKFAPSTPQPAKAPAPGTTSTDKEKDKDSKFKKPLLERDNSNSKLNPDAKPFQPVAPSMNAGAAPFSPGSPAPGAAATPTPPPPPHPMQQSIPLQPGPDQHQFKGHPEAVPMAPFYAPVPGRGPYRPEEEMFFQYPRGQPQGFVQMPFGVPQPGLVRAPNGVTFQPVPVGPGAPPFYQQAVYYPAGPVFIPTGMPPPPPPGALPVGPALQPGQIKRGLPPNVKMQAPQGPPQFPGFMMQQPPPGQFYAGPIPPGAAFPIQPGMHPHPHMMQHGQQPALLVAQKLAFPEDSHAMDPPPPPGSAPMKFQGVPNTDSIPPDGKGPR
eukprot:TRINITY_DN7049_c0_g1_i4.p1 TRINITY_DN7049_c0_g1~~TRINITY_DN7049_c0_g1_i4.p1  ORF type:complete len:362 (+),score=41.56 TRINITY_DN7049_c0_g1_i4:483-1568(+)